jgi:hypothetical protein
VALGAMDFASIAHFPRQHGTSIGTPAEKIKTDFASTTEKMCYFCNEVK